MTAKPKRAVPTRTCRLGSVLQMAPLKGARKTAGIVKMAVTRYQALFLYAPPCLKYSRHTKNRSALSAVTRAVCENHNLTSFQRADDIPLNLGVRRRVLRG